MPGAGRKKRRPWGGGGWPVAAVRAGNSRKRRRSAKPPPRRCGGVGDQRPPKDFSLGGVRHAGRGKKKAPPVGRGRMVCPLPDDEKKSPKAAAGAASARRWERGRQGAGRSFGGLGRFAPDLVRCGLRRRFPGKWGVLLSGRDRPSGRSGSPA